MPGQLDLVNGGEGGVRDGDACWLSRQQDEVSSFPDIIPCDTLVPPQVRLPHPGYYEVVVGGVGGGDLVEQHVIAVPDYLINLRGSKQKAAILAKKLNYALVLLLLVLRPSTPSLAPGKQIS